jgi:hypothetical protein
VKLRPLLLGFAAALGVLAWTPPAYAGKGDEAAAVLFGPILLALLAYPVGLALHALILAFSPRRGRGLTHKLERHRGKTILLGVLNTFFLLLVAITLKKSAPAIGMLAVLLWLGLAFVGSHGIARGLGAKVLGARLASDGPDDFKQTALGWFVLLFACAIPGLNLLLLPYWAIRATGGVVLAVLAVLVPKDLDDEDDPEPPRPSSDPSDPPGDLRELIA